ncbi:MAG: hypothetical protein GX625_19745 [Clostridiaceae bacterium]|nr:hypothetical protein [Clostridiaceae bacterium]
MARVGFNYAQPHRIKTDAGYSIDQSFIAHLHIPAATAEAADTDGIMAATNLAAAVQTITTGLGAPAWPRNVTIDCSASGVTSNVKITGTNFAGEAIDETIALNGTTAKAGTKAFKTVTKIELPIQKHAPELQVETATAAGTVSTAGNAAVTVKSALFDADEVVDVPVELGDDAAAIALAIRTALAANENIAEHFTVSGETDAVILTAKVAATNDDTLNIAIADGSGEGASVGVTTAATSANTTPGVAPDQVWVGWGDVFGLPYTLDHNTVVKSYFDNAADSMTIQTDATAIESNTFSMTGTANGEKNIDIYLIV